MIPEAVALTIGVLGGVVCGRPATRPPSARAVVWDPSPRQVRRLAPAGAEVVYLVRAGETGRVKIGTTTSWPSRVRQLATGMVGEAPRLEGLVPGGRDLEARLHRALAPHRVARDREWFELEREGAWRGVVDREAARG